MKDFRANHGRTESDSASHVYGGNPFHLPNIVETFSRSFGLLSSVGLAILLRPWRLLQMLPTRRGGLIGAFFAWGRLASIAIAAMLLFSPGYLQGAFPGWRTAALVCFFVSGLSVFAAIARCCSSVVSCAFWVVVTLYLGEHAVKPIGSFSVPTFAEESPTLQVADSEIEGEWEDMATGRPVSQQVVATHRNRSLQNRAIVRYASNFVRPKPLASAASENLNSVTNSVGSGIFSIIPSTNSLWAATGLSQGSAGWADGAALPDSAYFGNSAGRVGAVGTASGGGGGLGEGLDRVVSQVTSFIGQ